MEKEFDFNSKTGYAVNNKDKISKIFIFLPFLSFALFCAYFISLFMLGAIVSGNSSVDEIKSLKEEVQTVKAELRIQEAKNLLLSVQHDEQLARIEENNIALRLDYINKINNMKKKEISESNLYNKEVENIKNVRLNENLTNSIKVAESFKKANNSFMKDMQYEKQRQDALFKETMDTKKSK